MVIPSSKSCCKNIILSNFQLVIDQTEINLREMPSTLKLVEKIINLSERILIFHCNLIQLTIVYTHPKRPIIFLHEKYESTP